MHILATISKMVIFSEICNDRKTEDYRALLKNLKIFIKLFFFIFSQKWTDTKETAIWRGLGTRVSCFSGKLEIHQQIYTVGMLEC